MSQDADLAHDLGVIAQAFGCGEALARTIAALGRSAPHGPTQLLFPLPGRTETSLLTAGLAQEVAYGREGGVLVLHLIDPGQFYGTLVGLGDGQGPAQVEALREGRAVHYSGDSVVRLMESYACVAVAIARQLSERLAAMRQRMVNNALLSATGRICAELNRLAQAGEEGVIRPMPVFAELAVRVQSTRETVSRTVSQLERRGVLKRVEGGLALVAPHRLEEMIY